ncbi:YceI family protein [Spirosoma sp. KCTC 42546]|uniref:YceI family protein n=1 Tax=Spirosoma sp. KCTC 42546 TaxID=2520506 RepID=UPI00115BC5AF|nr:YceI family protein [Spirosoma sp. KCTC 42546]QDK80903.1 YceI family protein [Spirosoma sp. KCTC 42546]
MATTNWVVDPMHSEVQFKVKHLVISTVTGTFRNFEGGATTAHDDFDDAEVHFSLDVASVDTNQEMRDNHLKSADFFDADTYPKIAFKSTSFKKVDDDEYALTGELTMKGVTKPVTLKAEYGGAANDMHGNKKLGFEVTGKINRKEFGLTHNALTETGGLALGEDIKLIANIQLAQAA